MMGFEVSYRNDLGVSRQWFKTRACDDCTDVYWAILDSSGVCVGVKEDEQAAVVLAGTLGESVSVVRRSFRTRL